MDVPLYQAKSELFRALGHPVRIRVLELLNGGPQTVRQLLDALTVEASGLSQHLAVLRGTGLVIARRDGNTVEYTLGAGEVTGLLAIARQILTHLSHGQRQLLAELRTERAS
jgi:ArsR family transcriptional regulator